ncbi:polyprenyl diphosphate synthase [Nocardioides mangrovi]|nr:polyprenyl diphosphate synthase [Nocardioides mangrovi]
MDGNRRWARAAGHLDPRVGHRVGAEHLERFLGWCAGLGIEHVTAYVLSADNIRKRPEAEVANLLDLLATTIPRVLTRPDQPWRVHVSGDRSLLDERARRALAEAERATADRASHLTLAIAYDGRQDIVEGIRRSVALLDGRAPTVEEITAALPGGPVKEIDLVIRTSGEQRLSGFFPWQSVGAEIYSSERFWPAFSEADLAAALAFYADRRR